MDSSWLKSLQCLVNCQHLQIAGVLPVACNQTETINLYEVLNMYTDQQTGICHVFTITEHVDGTCNTKDYANISEWRWL